jgi:hypothetical protein
VNVICPDLVFALSLARLIGAEGTVDKLMNAPLPLKEVPEAPIMLYAITYAQTLVPVLRLKGVLIRTESGIVQLRAVMIVDIVPSQLGKASLNVTRSLCLIRILY